MIKAIIFDIDGTLVDSRVANISFFKDIFRNAGYAVPIEEQFENLLHLSMVDTIKALAKDKSEKEIQRLWEIGTTTTYPSQLQVLPYFSQEMVRTLSQKYNLALVTNRRRIGVENYFAVSKLQDYFSVIIAFEDVMNRKPHPEPLLTAAARLQVNPEECIYVGDALVDVQAAKAAGMQSILCNPQPGADGYITSFEQLPKQISGLDHKEVKCTSDY